MRALLALVFIAGCGFQPDLEIAPEDFTLVVLPDTQYYSAGRAHLYDAQTTWIAREAERLDIRAVIHEGDVINGFGAAEDEWQVADAAMALLEQPTASHPDGIPYGIAVGNHDLTRELSSTDFNRWFGAERFADRPWYGGNFGPGNDNSYLLIDGDGVELLLLFLGWDPGADPDTLAWAREVVRQHPERRVIAAAHFLLDGVGDQVPFSPQGRAVFDALGGEANVDLLVCGHIGGEGRRVDRAADRELHTLMADYQQRDNGGDGWLRILEMSPTREIITVHTYSPTRDEYEDDDDSFIELPWPLP